ncbi:hypothetical protein BSKO_01587 [Bryopsis sp. KO-2023]|nr:hypothetical protein BSKO_01587 [Bryopsis sp. KO-2023]
MLHTDCNFVSRIPRVTNRSDFQKHHLYGSKAFVPPLRIGADEFESMSSRTSDWSARSPSSTHPSVDHRINELQSRVLQLEDELAAQRGQILGWQSHRCLIEQALSEKCNETTALTSQLVAMQFQISAMHQITAQQARVIAALQRKLDVLSTLAFITSMMVCSLIVAWEWVAR